MKPTTLAAVAAALGLAIPACLGRDADFAVKIDLEKTNAPISPLIYGQFIEHVGKSIYGGAWAEMIVDRKFFFPVTDNFAPWGTADDQNWHAGPFHFLNASPWRVNGPAGCVTMDTNNPYVGAQSPVIQQPPNGQPAGISQDGLGFREGVGYVGRIVLAGQGLTRAPEVHVIFDNGADWSFSTPDVPTDFKSYPFSFTAPVPSTNARIEILNLGAGALKIGTLSLMPADNIRGWRKDVVDVLHRLDAPVYRWPGGNFVSGYDWRDGLGPRDLRPPRKNPAWWGIEPNDVGVGEFMDLMDILHAQAYVALNTGQGGANGAAKEVEYFNGSIATTMGKWREENGHPLPYYVRLWAVGNEMFGDWQLGHMPVAQYVKKNNAVADAIWSVDPNIQLVASGNAGPWDQALLACCADHMNFLSEHVYCGEKTNVVEHAKQLAQEIRRVAETERRYRTEIPGLAGKNIPIAMDEWNYWHGDYVYGELGCQYYLKDALGVAEGLHEFFRNSDLFYMANYAQAINVLGAVKTTTTAASFDATGLVLELYRRHYGNHPLNIFGDTRNVDVAAALSDDGQTLSISLVNPEPIERHVGVTFGSVFLKPAGVRWVISGVSPESCNHPGQPPGVKLIEQTIAADHSVLGSPPYSVALYQFRAPFIDAH